MPRTRTASGTTALNRQAVLDAALRITQAEGLDAVGIRRLASELGTWPAAIYHHLGDKDTVLDAVVDRVFAQVPLPPGDLDWPAWFRHLLTEGRSVLHRYPGVAGRTLVRGPTVPSMLRIVDWAIAKLADAGFGPDAPLACSILLNHAAQMTALDDALAPVATERAELRASFSRYADDAARPGLARAATAFPTMTPNEIYEYGLDRILDGLARRLRQLLPDQSPQTRS